MGKEKEKSVVAEPKVYKVEFAVRMFGEKHCIKCPLRDSWTDRCNILGNKYKNWDDQLKNCPLVEVDLNVLQSKQEAK